MTAIKQTSTTQYSITIMKTSSVGERNRGFCLSGSVVKCPPPWHCGNVPVSVAPQKVGSSNPCHTIPALLDFEPICVWIVSSKQRCKAKPYRKIICHILQVSVFHKLSFYFQISSPMWQVLVAIVYCPVLIGLFLSSNIKNADYQSQFYFFSVRFMRKMLE